MSIINIIDGRKTINREASRGKSMCKVIGGRRYNTDTATLLASDLYGDGNNNRDCGGTNTFLFRTPQCAYFVEHLTLWDGEIGMDKINLTKNRV